MKEKKLMGVIKKTTKKKAPVKKPVSTPKTKAKEMVDELLENVSIEKFEKPKTEIPVQKNESMKWLEEQTTQLSEQVERLRLELAEAKDKYAELYNSYQSILNNGSGSSIDVDSEAIKRGINGLFHELQDNYLRNPGTNQKPVTGAPNLIIWPAAFLNRMIEYLPFLGKEKRF